MPTFVWNLDTNTPSRALTDQTTAEYSSARGGSDLRLILTRGSSVSDVSEVLLDGAVPSGYVVGFLLRDPQNLDQGGEFETPTVLTRGASAADGYIGSTSTDTAPVRSLMGFGNPGSNQAAVTLSAVFYYVPVGGGAPVESQPFPWTVTPAYYQPGAPPVSQYPSFPSDAQLTAAVAAAAAAQPKLPTPTANGQFLFGNTDGSVHFGAFPTFLNVAFSSMVVTDEADFQDTVNCARDLTVEGNLNAILNPTNLSGPVPVAKGGTGAATAAAALTALGAASLASPTFTGTVTIPAGANIVGYAPVASPTFTGTVTIPAGAAIAGYAPVVAPTFTGTVTAGAFVGSGANLTDVAPFHPSAANYGTNGTGAGPGGGGTNNPTMDANIYGGPGNTTVFQRTSSAAQFDAMTLGDVSGEFTLEFPSTPVAAGTALGTIKFLNPYTGTLPATVFFTQLGVLYDPAGTSTSGTPLGPPDLSKGQLSASMTSTGLTISVSAQIVAHVVRIKYQYFIPPV